MRQFIPVSPKRSISASGEEPYPSLLSLQPWEVRPFQWMPPRTHQSQRRLVRPWSFSLCKFKEFLSVSFDIQSGLFRPGPVQSVADVKLFPEGSQILVALLLLLKLGESERELVDWKDEFASVIVEHFWRDAENVSSLSQLHGRSPFRVDKHVLEDLKDEALAPIIGCNRKIYIISLGNFKVSFVLPAFSSAESVTYL